MSETVNPRLIKSNIDLLTRIVKKPNFVTEKQLSRPPFKFLHELLTLIVKNTGYLRGLFTEDEFQFDQVSTKEAKIVFLDKLIDAVGFINSKAVDVKSAKIVSGTEVEKTNKLLNELAKAVTDKKPFVEAVEKVRKGLKPPAPAPTGPGTSKAGATVVAGTSNTKKPAASGVVNKTATKPTPGTSTSKTAAKPAPTKAPPGGKSKLDPKSNAKAPASKQPANAKTSKAPAKSKQPEPAEPSEDKSLPELSESSEQNIEQVAKTSPADTESESIESTTIKTSTLEEPGGNDDLQSGENSLDAAFITNGSNRGSAKDLSPSIASAGTSNNRESIHSPSTSRNANIEPEFNNNNFQPNQNEVNNLDNNLDQLVANLGLDDDEDEEELGRQDQMDNAVVNQRNPIMMDPNDSGIDSKSNSVSTTQSEPPEFQQMEPLPQEPEISYPSSPIIMNPSIREQEEQQQQAADSRMRSASTSSKQSQRSANPPVQMEQQEPTTVLPDRKKSATIRGRRTAKSSVPPQTLPVSGTSAMDAALNYRGQNFPSSASPSTLSMNGLQQQQQRPPSAMKQPQQGDQYDQNGHDQMLQVRARPPPTARSARPSSSRPAPPRVMTASRSRLTRLMENRNESAVPNGTVVPVTPDVWPPPEGLNLEMNLDDDPEEGDDYLMSSKKLQDSLLKMDRSNDMDSQDSQFGGGAGSDKGRLVQQLIATKSELEGNVGPKSAAPKQEDNQNTSTDTKILRTNVHELCQSIGGLSKALNYLHEDVDPMLNELEKWREEYRNNLLEIDRIKVTTDKELDPLRKELEKIELEVVEHAERLLAAKASVHRNSLSIGKLIESI